MFRHLALLGLIVASLSGTPMTDEDVVRLFVSGTPADELIRTIGESEVDFDLSEEMLEELRLAGIPRKILTAMRERQIELAPLPTTPQSATNPSGPRLVVRLNPDRKENEGPATIKLLNALDPQVSEALGLRQGDLTVTDLGVALLCRTADHVPDHWRSKSPLGRDFATPRHRMLLYVSGAASEPASKFRDSLSKLAKSQVWRESMEDLLLLTLEVPAELSVDLEPGIAHDLSLVLAIRVGERNYVALSDEFDGLVLAESGATTLLADLRGRSKNPLKARVAFRDRTER